MRDWHGKRYWIVGASEGLGRALALQLSRAGVELVLSARNEDRLAKLAGALPGRASVVPLDVRKPESVATAADRVGEIDGLVYMAGVYWPQRAREWDAEKVEAMCDVNFTGAARVLGRVVPEMARRDYGHVVLAGSLAGYRGLPRSVGYGSSKAAVMHLAESLHAEFRNGGVEVQLVNPGFVRTRLTDKNDFNMPFLMEPDAAAREVFEHMTAGGFRRGFPAGFAAMFRAAQFLPDWAYYRLFS
ncbi:SDR family NAD(P)-dependent oxidoreductase [Tranquillimonas alkanivorans]|uniref:Short-chain dehydrogenase n=1 Tax=Tranquillimonas alkanivorans TaxID=441119 RepID=A0A1I5PS92_9RHOB|nr:SDR family NAD(P)-dependent oxidoreductase [Tranquillimonas alkanivorans]SFP36854.1 Short-chain dehydrogenase [Tranquillimonas alkanivorans]